MTEWIRRKFQRTPSEQSNFTSYVEKEVDGFVVIPHASVGVPEVNSITNIKELTRVDCDYESLYSYLNHSLLSNDPRSSTAGYPPMGCSPSLTTDTSNTELQDYRNRHASLVTVVPLPPNTTPTKMTENNSSLELLGTNSFLDGIPFKLSNSLNFVEEIHQLQKESFDFLKQKTDILERLDYNFRVENEVLKESMIKT